MNTQMSLFGNEDFNAKKDSIFLTPKEVAKKSDSVLYVGETKNLMYRCIAVLTAFAESLPLPEKKQTKQAKKAKQEKNLLVRTIFNYSPAMEFMDDWTELFNENKTPVSVEQVRDHILWHLHYWKRITDEQYTMLSKVDVSYKPEERS